MTEGYNPFPGFLTAPTTCELQNSSTDGLEEGCLAYVVDTGRFYRLSTKVPAPAVDGVNVLSTWNGPDGLDAFGAPCVQPGQSAHSPTGIGRWVRTSILDSTASPSGSGTIIYRPNGVSEGNVFATDVEVAAQVALANGALIVEVDDSLMPPATPAPWTVPMDGQGRLTLAGANIPTGPSGVSPNLILRQPLGGVIRNLYEVTDGLVIQLDARTGPCIIQDDANLLTFSRGARLQNVATTARSGLYLPQGGVLVASFNDLAFDIGSFPIPIVECGPAPGAGIGFIAFSSTGPAFGPTSYDNTFKGPPGAGLYFIYDSTWFYGVPNQPAWQGPFGFAATLSQAVQASYDDAAHTPTLVKANLITPFVQPAFWSTITPKFDSTQCLHVGDFIGIGGGSYAVVTILDSENIELRALNSPGAPAPGATVLAGQPVLFPTFTGPGGSVQNAIDALKALVPLASGEGPLDGAGALTVLLPAISGSTPVTYSYQSNGVAPTGFLYLSNVNAGVSFTITSKGGAADAAQTVYWQVWSK
jgi:hypothetical protein